MRRYVVLEDSRTERGANARGFHQIFMRDGQTVQGPERGAASLRFVGSASLLPRLFGHQRDNRIDLWIDALDLLKVGVQCFASAQLLAADQVRHFGGSEEADIGTFGHEQLRSRRGAQQLRGFPARNQRVSGLIGHAASLTVFAYMLQ